MVFLRREYVPGGPPPIKLPTPKTDVEYYPGLVEDVGPRPGLEKYVPVYCGEIVARTVCHLLDPVELLKRPKLTPMLWTPLCGMYNKDKYWKGTKNDDERDIARALPLCQNCGRKAVGLPGFSRWELYPDGRKPRDDTRASADV